MALVYDLAKIWAVDDSNRLPRHVDLIAIVSIGSTTDRPTRGVLATTFRALDLMKSYHFTPSIVYGAFAGNDDKKMGVRTYEEDWKREMLGPEAKYAGKVWTTVTECLAFKATFPDAKSVIFVTEEAHSRRARFIWKCLWKEAEVYIVPVKLAETIDQDALMEPYRNPWKALFFQAAPIVIYKPAAMLGAWALKLLGGFHQPTARS